MLNVDLNCDLGEGGQSDQALIQFLSSINLSCGAHAGDQETILEAACRAVEFGLRIGAHPAYPDRENFGRVSLDISLQNLKDSWAKQLNSLSELVQSVGGFLKYVKPHGALYHDVILKPELGIALIDATQQIAPQLAWMGLANSKLIQLAKQSNIAFIAEAFADRRYQANGLLCPRHEPWAVIREPATALQQVRSITERQVIAQDGTQFPIQADSICIHGDNPAALSIAKAIAAEFQVSIPKTS